MIPYKQAEDLLTLLGPAALTLIVLLAAVWLVLVYLKRSGKSIGGPRRLKVLERLALSRRTALVLVEYDGRPLLLSQAGDQLKKLE